MSDTKQYALVGFANSGKTTLFNQLTQSKQTTGNWAGVTVSVKQKSIVLNHTDTLVTDLPGIPSLTKRQHQGQDLSITHDFITKNHIDCLINVVDATQLQRQLYLTMQLLELNLPMVVVLSKTDRKEAQAVNVDKLSQQLSCPVIAIDARSKVTKQSIALLLAEQLKKSALPSTIAVPKLIADKMAEQDVSLLGYERWLNSQGCDSESANKALIQVMQVRYQFIQNLLNGCIDKPKQQRSFSDKIDQLILHPLLGVPIFLLMMYLLFMFAINVGSAFIDFFDILAGVLFVDYPTQMLSSFNLPVWLLTIIEGLGSGIQTVATFIPVIVCLFIGLSLLETSGYLARAAFVVESVMQKIGLPGKAFVPLIVGFGCTVPAVMATRVLDSERERIATVMMSPFMSCGARLPVYALFAAAFFPDSGQNIVFVLYLIGIAAALFTGLLLKTTVLTGNSKMNVLELPLYELPQFSYLVNRVYRRTKSFIFGAGKTIVLVVCVLNFFNSLGTDGSFGNHDKDNSVLSQGAQLITPVLMPLGIKEDNWQAGVGIITGIFAKEALVATFNSLYSSTSAEPSAEISFNQSWQQAVDSIKENLLGIAPEDPLGVDVGEISDLVVAAQEQQVEVTTYTAMQTAFDGKIGAFCYLLFILLYTPCAAAMGAIKNEVGNRWALFAAFWSFSLAYLTATFVYQLVTFSQHVMFSSVALLLVLTTLGFIFLWLKSQGKKILTIPIAVSF